MFSKKQTNGFFNAVQAVGFNAHDFTIRNDDNLFITHLPTGFIFRVAPLVSPGKVSLVNYHTPDNKGVVAIRDKFRSLGATDSWETTYGLFSNWLAYIKQEEETPDLWAEAAKTAQLFAPTSTPTDDKFTRAELAEVQGQLRLLQQSFTTAALPEAARQKLIELTQTAAVKAEGLTKKDWQNWLIGGFISAIASCALNPTQAAEVLKLVKAAFGGLFLH